MAVLLSFFWELTAAIWLRKAACCPDGSSHLMRVTVEETLPTCPFKVFLFPSTAVFNKLTDSATFTCFQTGRQQKKTQKEKQSTSLLTKVPQFAYGLSKFIVY